MPKTVGLTLEDSKRIIWEYQNEGKPARLDSFQVALEHSAQLSDDERLTLVQDMEKVMLRGGYHLKVVGTIARPALAAVKCAVDHNVDGSIIVLVLNYGPDAYEATLVCVYPPRYEGDVPRHRVLATNAVSEAPTRPSFSANHAKRDLADARQMYQRATSLASVASEMLSHAGNNRPSRILIVREMSHRASIRHGLVGVFKQYGFENDDFWELNPHDSTLPDAIAAYATSEHVHMLLPGSLCTSNTFVGVRSPADEAHAHEINWHPLSEATPCELRFNMEVPKGAIVTRYNLLVLDRRRLTESDPQQIGSLSLDHERIVDTDTKDELLLTIDMWGLVTVTARELGRQKIAARRTFSLYEPVSEDSGELWMPEPQEYSPAPSADTQGGATATIDRTVQLSTTQALDTKDSGTLERRMASLVAPVFGIHQNRPRATLTHAIGIVYVDFHDTKRKMKVLAPEGTSLPFTSQVFQVQATSSYGELVLGYAQSPTKGATTLESEDFRELAHLWNDSALTAGIFGAKLTLESETDFYVDLNDSQGRHVSLGTSLPADNEA